MTAFVLGATGYVGREVVRQLAVRGEKAFAHVRPDSKELSRWEKTFADMGATIDTTAWDVDALAARWKDVKPTVVYICIGTTRKKAKSDALVGNIYETVDFGLTKLAADAAAASGAKPRLVYLSSVGANASSSSDYLAWRGKAEDAVKASGVPWVIARPSMIHGERDEGRPGEAVISVVGDGLLSVVGMFGAKKLRAKYRSTTGDILAAALIRLGEHVAPGTIAEGDDLR
ncbi:NAD-dependent epimerase/dehydratase family protein [soil metagenome]